jgi:hypothetical protein
MTIKEEKIDRKISGLWMEGIKNTYKILVGKVVRKRPRARRGNRWKDGF